MQSASPWGRTYLPRACGDLLRSETTGKASGNHVLSVGSHTCTRTHTPGRRSDDGPPLKNAMVINLTGAIRAHLSNHREPHHCTTHSEAITHCNTTPKGRETTLGKDNLHATGLSTKGSESDDLLGTKGTDSQYKPDSKHLHMRIRSGSKHIPTIETSSEHPTTLMHICCGNFKTLPKPTY